MPPLRNDRWLDAVLYGGAAAFVVIAALSITAAVEVARGRGIVERNVGALVGLQRAIDAPEKAPAALDALAAHADPAVAAAAKTRQVSATILALRAANARESERLGRYIVGLYATVGVLVFAGLAILFLIHRLRAAARAMTRIAEQRIAMAEEEHAHRLATLRGLAATTAHEVNNPLTAMSLNLELLRSDETLSPPMRAAVEANLDGVTRIARIVAELREAGAPVAATEVELGKVIEATLRLLEHRLKPRAQIVRALEAPGRVKAEYVALGQVVTNLLLNAAEAFGERPVGENHIRLATRAIDAEWVELSVSDDGPGFDAKAFPSLMTPFVTTKPNGNGLGLYACKRIIERFNGTFRLEPLDRGARVVVQLRRA